MPKITFITGATSGFGKACAYRFASHGCDLILNGRRADRLEQIAQDIESKYNVAVLTLPFDVRDEKAVKAAVGSIPNDWKEVEVLINNAGLAVGRDFFEEAAIDDWERMIDTNIKGFLYVAHALAPLMTARGSGHIINMGSIAGKEVYEKGNVYCATKFAVDALSQGMRIDLLRHGIKVTSINPGAAETEFALVRFKGDAATANKTYEGLKPLTAEDVADIVYYCTTLPPHVCINDLTVTCLQQASAVYFHRTNP
ncbi:MAG: hypothetical protein RJA57_1252 [Bacteroidota bacterium]|jgi:NADP-dependent 3-hydroxy acid dehydrogenase YdfG